MQQLTKKLPLYRFRTKSLVQLVKYFESHNLNVNLLVNNKNKLLLLTNQGYILFELFPFGLQHRLCGQTGKKFQTRIMNHCKLIEKLKNNDSLQNLLNII